MNKFKKIISGIVALSLTAAIAVIPVYYEKNTPTVDAAVDTWNDDWLHCEEDRICDANGNEVRLTGVNWFGFNCTENVIHYSWLSVDIKTQLQSIVDHGYNLLRVPVSTELLYSWMIGDPLASSGVTAYEAGDTVVNPELIDPETGQGSKNSMFLFDQLMKMCKELGMKVMIDVHSTQSHNSGHNFELWYGFEGNSETISGASIGMMGTKEWIDSLVWLADKYSNDDTLLAYDLKNEPHGKGDDCAAGKGAKWDDSIDEWNWKYAAETCGNAIMEVNPNALIVVEGIEVYAKIGEQVADGNGTPYTGDPWKAPGAFGWGESSVSNYYGAWWGGNLRGVRDYPIVIESPKTGYSQLVYSPHDYGPSVYAQTWFDKDFTEQTLLDDYWYDTWSYIDEEHIAPLLIGEWGGHMDGGKNQKWMELLRDYMNKQKINATFWCYNTNSGDTGGLLLGGQNGVVEWDTEKHAMVEESLWQTDDGEYIGLDHEVALGANGISLNDYYGNKGDQPTPTTPATPEPGTPTPTEPATPEPSTPEPTEPGTPEPSTPAPGTPIPTEPGTPEPSTPAPTEPATPEPGTPAPGETKRGDVDLDGDVKISDLVALCKHVVGVSGATVSGTALLAADCDCNGVVEAADTLELAKFLVKKIDGFQEQYV
ncbi:MAG: cellulase family glycosylhydrolase [Ruminococcus sp.]|jgi:aryl-phospho-beta-D-glucosidase BglC (GH1 family)|nr:cellulase family glycosylhydrolase [Ruminococcus sp.]